MKVQRYGQAKILTQQEVEQFFTVAFTNPRDRALLGLCLYTGCRIAEACAMHWLDAFSAEGKVRSPLILRKANTKGKQATRSIAPHGALVSLLVDMTQRRGSFCFQDVGGGGICILRRRIRFCGWLVDRWGWWGYLRTAFGERR